MRAKRLVLEPRELVPHPGGLLKLQIARVLQHEFLQPLDLPRHILMCGACCKWRKRWRRQGKRAPS